METKKKVIIGVGGGLLLLIAGIFGYKKGWFSKKTDDGNSVLDMLKVVKKDDEVKTSTETNVSTASSQTAPSYRADGTDNGAIDLYHKMISVCAEVREEKGNGGFMREYMLKSGIQGKTFGGLAYNAIKSLYKDEPYFEEAMEIVGSKEQLRKDINQYINEGTFRV